jgi:hypothetical protein
VDGTHFEGCSLGPTGRISLEPWKPWSEPFHETEQRELLLRLHYGLALFQAPLFLLDAKIKSGTVEENSTDLSMVSWLEDLLRLLRVHT